jgi:flagellar hook-length control protein FliK
MTTNSLASNIQQGGQAASAATAKKNAKRLSINNLRELLSSVPLPAKPAAKSTSASFKKILEPAKAASNAAAAKVEQAQEKKVQKTADQVLDVPVAAIDTDKKAKPGKQAKASDQATAKTLPSANLISRNDFPQQKLEQPSTTVRPTIDPRSPMHGQPLGNNDSGRALVTDVPKAKTAAQKDAAVTLASIEQNTASAKNAETVQPSIEPKAATSPLSEGKAKTPAAKSTATSVEKARIHYQVSDTESNPRNIADKQAKPAQSRPDIAYQKQNPESVAIAPAKIDINVAAVSEQFSPPTVSNAGAVHANTSTTAASAAAHAAVNVPDQVASVAAAASYKIGQKITVNLNPPELGRINIKFEKNGDEVIGRIEVEKSQTKHQIDLNLSQIVQNLQDSGVPLKRLEVVLQEQPLGNQQEFADQAQPDWDGKHRFASEKNYPNLASAVPTNEQFSSATHIDTYISNKSVNILV